MALNSESIRKMYTGMATYHYDLPITHFFRHYKKIAFQDSSLKAGDNVLVFCCGTGLDFPYILNKIGTEGKIVGVDFSEDMLKIARKRIKKKGWENVELINADVTNIEGKIDGEFDVAVCTLGISIIPEYQKAYHNMLSLLKQNGELIIGDAQLASGWKKIFNPLFILMGKRFGASSQGHRNSLELCSLMKSDLADVRKKSFFMGLYFYCIGKKR